MSDEGSLPKTTMNIPMPAGTKPPRSKSGWTRLDERLPDGDEFVVLFNEELHNDSDYCGLPVAVSNADFARNPEAIAMGYTHWAKVPYPLPS